MQHERRFHIEIFNKIENSDGQLHPEPHDPPRFHAGGETLTLAAGPQVPQTHPDRGEMLMELERLQALHPDEALGYREIIVNVYQWPALVTGGYAPSPNDMRRLDLEEARAKKL